MLLVLGVLLVGLVACGGDGDASETDSLAGAVEGAYQAIDELALATAEERIYSDIVDNGGDLPAATDAYIDVVRQSIDAGSLTTDQAIRRLTDVANDVSEWCGQCADAIDRELENLRG